jgi:hypothetical protein
MGQEFREAATILEALFARLRHYNVKFNISKCHFLMPFGYFSGHQVSAKVLQPLDKYKEVVNRFPVPTNTSEVRSFLGLVQFDEHFIPNLAQLAEPLAKILRGRYLLL